MSDESHEALESGPLFATEVDEHGFGLWGAQTYSSIINNLDISEDTHQPSTGSTPVTSTTMTTPGFLTSYNLKQLNLAESDQIKVDLRGLDFVEPPNESLICTICAAPFVNPMELECEHIFCEDCVYEHLSCGIQSSSSCPKCRRSIDTIRPVPRLLNQLLDELEVECPNKRSGCLLPLSRYTIHDHVNKYCEYEELRCPKTNCNGTIQRRYVEKGCLHTHVECEVCNEFVMEKDLAHHEDNVCPAAIVDCDYCHLEMRRGQVRKHLDVHCPMVITDCLGKVVGCKFSAQRHSMDDHTATCPMAAMSTYLTNLSEKQSALAEENRRLRNQVDTLNARLDELDDSHKKLAATLKKERRRASMAETSAAASTRIEELHARFDDIQADWNTRLDNATSEAARLHMEMMNQAQQNGQRFYTVNGTITSLRSQINHLMANSRGSGGNAGGTASSSGMTGSGANAGGGVSLDTARREPPKL